MVIADVSVVNDSAMWESMQAAPRVFGVHFGGVEHSNQDLFQDWASINGGDFRYLV